MFENVDGRMDAGRTPDAGVTGILIAHLGAFSSGELKSRGIKNVNGIAVTLVTNSIYHTGKM